MSKKNKFILAALPFVVLTLALVAIVGLGPGSLDVLHPSGTIARQQRNLMITTTLLMLIVVVPVFVLTFFFAWKYRASNAAATYKPEWDHHPLAEFTWWALPCAIIAVLALITWVSTHQLDPFKELSSHKKPLTIQVVALQWKWLFIYPEQHIASVNFVQFPDQRPLNFQITADAPMNSFWIPKLGGQVYAMSGMSTQLHLMADKPGDYRGISANMSGEGFSGMKFTARASTQKDFDAWVLKEKRSGVSLDKASYDQLALPSKDNAATTYTLAKHDLYDTIVMKYMAPAEEHTHTHSHEAASTSKHKDTQ